MSTVDILKFLDFIVELRVWGFGAWLAKHGVHKQGSKLDVK